MRTHILVAAVLAAAKLGAQDTLQIIRHTPSDTASPGNVITVTFDRPVFGNIEQAILPARIFSVSPALPGRVDWRDPITLRFTPEQPLVPGQVIAVRISDAIRGIDGSRMASPYEFSFRVPGPRLLSRSFDGQFTLPPNGKFDLTYSAPVDPARLERNASISYTCSDSTKGTLPLYITGQRQVPPGSYYYMYNLWGAPGDTSATRFFRVVELTPSSSPPPDCALRISLPTTEDDSSFGRIEVYRHRSAKRFTFAKLDCEEIAWCSLAMLRAELTSPISDEEASKHISVVGVPHVQATREFPTDFWRITFPQTARSTYTVRVDTAIRDLYGRTLEGTNERQISVGDHRPGLVHPSGLLTVLSASTRTIPVRTINVSAFRLIVTPVRDADRQLVLANIAYSAVPEPRGTGAETTLVSVPARLNTDTQTDVLLPAMVFRPNGQLTRAKLEIVSLDSSAHPHREHLAETITVTGGSLGTVLQATDLAMTLKVGLGEAIVHVTSASDGRPHGGVVVRDIGTNGSVIAQATTDANGVARLVASIKPAPLRSSLASTDMFPPIGHLVEATLGSDRLTMPVAFRAIGYRDANPLATEALGGRREPLPTATVAIFVDRPIYRPGELLFLKAVARSGAAGELRVPKAGDSIRVLLRRPYRSSDDQAIRDSVVPLNAFGTYTDSIVLSKTLPLGDYTAEVEYIAANGRVTGTTNFTLGEYRAPEFSVEVQVDSQSSNKDTLAFSVSGSYFLGSPMRGGTAKWELTSTVVDSWAPSFPNSDDWWFGDGDSPQGVTMRVGQGSVVLDDRGRAIVKFGITDVPKIRPTEFALTAFVSDANRQQVSASNGASVLGSLRHIGMNADSGMRSAVVGKPVKLRMKVVDDRGKLIPNIRVLATVTRRRWARSGTTIVTADTVIARDTLVSRDRPVDYAFRSDSVGNYLIRFAPLETTDEVSPVSFSTNVASRVPVFAGGSPFLLPLIADHQHVTVGDTAHIRFVSPFDSASAWVSTEREGLISSRVISVHGGTNTVDVPVESKHVPNVWISVSLIARRPSGARLDSASDRVRAGYVELLVDASTRQLKVALRPDRREYVPRSTASIRIDVRDAAGRGTRSEVALWAVDEGLLSMMPYSIPDLFEQFYRTRGLTFELRSTIPAILTNNAAARLSLQAAQLQLQEVVMTALSSSVSRLASPTTIRSDFRSTAFFLGNVVTDASGRATARPRLPDNLTTFRIIGVAVDASSSFGTGTDSIVVSLPLAARASLPRFVRPTDSLLAGTVINARDTLSRRIDVATSTVGLSTIGPSRQSVDFKHGVGVEARFSYVVPQRNAVRDTVKIQLSATDGKDEDATETSLPVKPDFTPRAHTIIGSARGSADVVFLLPAGIDPQKSRVSLRIGTTPLAPMLAAYDRLRVYPYYCTEQISSMGRAMIAIWNATRNRPHPAFKQSPIPALQLLVDEISARQTTDGAIRYWRDSPWTTPWLTAYAGLFLLDARDAGAAVDTVVIRRLTSYMTGVAAERLPSGENRFEQREKRLDLGYHVAAVELLRRLGSPNIAEEDALLAINTRMTWEDRLRLAEVESKRMERQPAARAIVDDAWKAIVTAGNRVDLPDTANPARDFVSRIAPAAQLLTTTLALEPERPLIGGLVETVLQQSRAEGAWTWSTQDYASAVLALAAFTDTVSKNPHVRLVGRRGTLADTEDSMVKVSLTDLLETDANGRRRLSLRVESDNSDRVFYAVQVDEVPLDAPTRPDIKGMVVERWYERYSDGKAITSIQEGELVRVRLRVTVPANRQFVALEDPLPAGLEAIDFNLRTSAQIESTDAAPSDQRASSPWQAWLYGSWMNGTWSPWEHRELRDDRVVYFARVLWPGAYEASYIARATTSGNFVRPPAHAEEMYNPALQGRSDGGRFRIDTRPR